MEKYINFDAPINYKTRSRLEKMISGFLKEGMDRLFCA
jgi:hypothetical protein